MTGLPRLFCLFRYFGRCCLAPDVLSRGSAYKQQHTIKSRVYQTYLPAFIYSVAHFQKEREEHHLSVVWSVLILHRVVVCFCLVFSLHVPSGTGTFTCTPRLEQASDGDKMRCVLLAYLST